MNALLQRTKTFLTPSTSSSSLAVSGKFRTEKDATLLFPTTKPEIDGEDCLQDCSSCTEQLPRKWEIDEDDKLYGHVNGWETHLIVGTGKSDWVRDITDEKGSLMQAIGKIGQELPNGKLMLSASNMPGSDNDHGDYADEGRTRCILLPKWQMVENVGVNEADWLINEVIAKSSTNSTAIIPTKTPETPPSEISVGKEDEPVSNASELNSHAVRDDTILHEPAVLTIPRPVLSTVQIRPLHHQAVILMCSHGTRDWRCGKSAPMLKREFERHLRPLGLYRDYNDTRPDGVGIYYINHTGGHKYSANVMVYRRSGSSKDPMSEIHKRDEAVQGIWLARVRPEDCENIVKYTVLQGKVVKPERQLRGGFDRERGVLSW